MLAVRSLAVFGRKNALYELQGFETLVVRIAVVCGVQAQTEVLEFQLGRVGDTISRESGSREETQQLTKCPPAHFGPCQIDGDGARFANRF